jgi:hypothetical protein
LTFSSRFSGLPPLTSEETEMTERFTFQAGGNMGGDLDHQGRPVVDGMWYVTACGGNGTEHIVAGPFHFDPLEDGMRGDVYWCEGDFDEEDVFAPLTIREGTLTTEHTESQDGLPVLVAEDGRVLRAGDLEPGTVLKPHKRGTIALWNYVLGPAAREAGFDVRWSSDVPVGVFA